MIPEDINDEAELSHLLDRTEVIFCIYALYCVENMVLTFVLMSARCMRS